MVFMTTESVDQEYPQLKQSMFRWGSNKASDGGPVPMEIGAVAGVLVRQKRLEPRRLERGRCGRGRRRCRRRTMPHVRR